MPTPVIGVGQVPDVLGQCLVSLLRMRGGEQQGYIRFGLFLAVHIASTRQQKLELLQRAVAVRHFGSITPELKLGH